MAPDPTRLQAVRVEITPWWLCPRRCSRASSVRHCCNRCPRTRFETGVLDESPICLVRCQPLASGSTTVLSASAASRPRRRRGRGRARRRGAPRLVLRTRRIPSSAISMSGMVHRSKWTGRSRTPQSRDSGIRISVRPSPPLRGRLRCAAGLSVCTPMKARPLPP